MIDLNIEEPEEGPTQAPDIVPIFLGLYLLVLAFFIMLVSISTFEKVKSTAVMDSLSSTFATVLPPTGDPTDFNAKDGDIIAGEAFQEQISTIFTTAIQVEKVEVVQPGRLMRLQMKSNALFRPDRAEVREDQLPLLDRVVAVLSNRPPGLRQDIEVVIGTRALEGGTTPVGQTLELARVGELARTMVGRGAPPDSVAVGVKIGDPGEVEMWFWVRAVEETQQRFEAALEAARARPSDGAAPEPLPAPVLEVRP